jgi:hypothetical protein
VSIGLFFDTKWGHPILGTSVRNHAIVLNGFQPIQLGSVEIDRLEELIDDVLYSFDAQVARRDLLLLISFDSLFYGLDAAL